MFTMTMISLHHGPVMKHTKGTATLNALLAFSETRQHVTLSRDSQSALTLGRTEAERTWTTKSSIQCVLKR